MIKVSFHKAQFIMQHHELQKCKHLLCHWILKEEDCTVFFFGHDDMDYIQNKHIKSIEHINPTDL